MTMFPVTIISPTDDDIRQLAGRYPHFHPLNLEDCRTETEFPKLEHHADYLFLVIHFPLWDEQQRIVRPTEVDIFVAKGTLVMAHTGALPPLVELFTRAQQDEAFRDQALSQGASPLLYDLLNRCVNCCYPLAERLDHDLRRLEEDLFSQDTRFMLTEIAVTRRTLIALRRILRPHLDIVRALAAGNWSFIHEDLDVLLG